MADLQTGPFGTMLHASAYVDEGVPVIAVKNIGDNRIDAGDIPKVGEDAAARLSRYLLRRDDILFARKGAVERRALVREEEEGWIQGSDCIRLRFSESGPDATYISYVMGTEQYRSWIQQHAHGATMPSLNQEILGLIPLPLPPLRVQKAIARILSGLDQKIELNCRMNRTLATMMTALFKSWFVDFDPVHAKQTGRDIGLPTEVFGLFPDRFSDSNSGALPEGWEVRPIGKEVLAYGGGTPSTKNREFWEGGVHPFCTPKDMSGLSSPILMATERHLTDAGVAKVSSGILPKGTLLMSSRAPIGYLAIAETPVTVNQGIIAVVPEVGISNLYLLHWARENMETIVSNANGSTFLEISKKNFRMIPMLVPGKEVMDEFNRRSCVLYEKMLANLRESASLASIRDTLLPKLISGQLSIQDAERFVGDAV
ncbi:restriction endonuclease subunit S [Endothiovibrio diazotrophicus]